MDRSIDFNLAILVSLWGSLSSNNFQLTFVSPTYRSMPLQIEKDSQPETTRRVTGHQDACRVFTLASVSLADGDMFCGVCKPGNKR